jgi:hypothetical protein
MKVQQCSGIHIFNGNGPLPPKADVKSLHKVTLVHIQTEISGGSPVKEYCALRNISKGMDERYGSVKASPAGF